MLGCRPETAPSTWPERAARTGAGGSPPRTGAGSSPPRTPDRCRCVEQPASPEKRRASGRAAARGDASPAKRCSGGPRTPAKKASGDGGTPAKASLSESVPIEHGPAPDDAGAAAEDAADGRGAEPVFRPAHFLRCHSMRHDRADVRTELWDCKFEPGDTGVVATCGGRSVCLLHAASGLLLKKWTHPAMTEVLSALAWMQLRLDDVGRRRFSVLAVGGLRQVFLLHPDNLTWYGSFSVGGARCREVTALVAHPRRSRLLLCATGDRTVSMWDVGVPTPPKYAVTPTRLLQLTVDRPALTLVLVADRDLLLAGCEDGLRGWRVTPETAKKCRTPDPVRYTLPACARGERQVDGLALLDGSRLAVKCTGRRCVYVWPLDLLAPLADADLAPLADVELSTPPGGVLAWSDTEACYLGLGAGRTLLAAGDDCGRVWLYDVRAGGASGGLPTGEPACVLQWPRLEDSWLAYSRKLPLHLFDILVNRVCLSDDEKHLVAVTNNNMVCIWRRVVEDQT